MADSSYHYAAGSGVRVPDAAPAAYTPPAEWNAKAAWVDPSSWPYGANGVGLDDNRYLGGDGKWYSYNDLPRNSQGQVYVAVGVHSSNEGNAVMPIYTTTTGQDPPSWSTPKVLDTQQYLDDQYSHGWKTGFVAAGSVFALGTAAAAATGTLGTGTLDATAVANGTATGAGGTTSAVSAGSYGLGAGDAQIASSAAGSGSTAAGTGAATTAATTAGSSALKPLVDAAGNVNWGNVASAALLGTAYGETGNAPKIDTSALNDNAKATQAMAQEQNDWARGVYDNTLKPQADAQAGHNANIQAHLDMLSGESSKAAAGKQSVYNESYTPVNQKLAADALNFDSKDYADKLSANAQAAVRTQYAAADKTVADQLAERGNNLSGNMAASMTQKSALSQAAALAGADSTARTTADQVGFDRLGVAAQQGNQIAASANADRNTSGDLATSSSAVGTQTMNNYVNAVNTTNSGVSTAISGMNTAGSQLANAANMQYSANRDAYNDKLGILGLGAGLLSGKTTKATGVTGTAAPAGTKDSTPYGTPAQTQYGIKKIPETYGSL